MTSSSVFASYLTAKSIFKGDRDILRPSYIPDSLPHRDMQIDQLASIMATALRGGRPSNVLIFGKTGTGKTAAVRFLEKEIKKVQKEQAQAYTEASLPDSNTAGPSDQFTQTPIGSGPLANQLTKVQYVYINCEVVDTQYGVLQNIGNCFVRDWDNLIPFTGWPLERVYNTLHEKIDQEKVIVVVILDEIDKLVYKSGDDVLYHLSTINDTLKNAKVSIIGISNDLKFTEFLDPRVRSRLGEEKLVFPPYNAEQLKDILNQRAELAFDSEILEAGVISLCAALAAQEHGDARRALDLLRIAAEISERSREPTITTVQVEKAKNKIELDCVSEVVRTLPTHSKLMLYGITLNGEMGKTKLTTGDVYETYQGLCRKTGVDPLTQRRITDLISELDMLGIAHARVISKGRYGRTKEIELSVPINEAKNILIADDLFEELKDFKPKFQTTLL